MKLKNKKTGEIGYFCLDNWDDTVLIIMNKDRVQLAKYNSIADLNKEWEDYEEPKEYWYIDYDGEILCGDFDNSSTEKMMISIGNHFESIEEAKKVVEKLKAIKRLKDKGMKKYSFHREKGSIDLDFYTLTILAPRDEDSLELLFGGEECLS